MKIQKSNGADGEIWTPNLRITGALPYRWATSALATGVGFEPTVNLIHDGLVNRCFKPLSHPALWWLLLVTLQASQWQGIYSPSRLFNGLRNLWSSALDLNQK